MADHLQHSVATVTTGCVALLDLEHFKRMADRYGHAMGDAVLIRFAEVVRSVLRGSDVAAELGGEEFALQLPGTNCEEEWIAWDRIGARLEWALMRADSGAAVSVKVSSGISPLTDDGKLSAALAAADRALYLPKSGGRNRLELAA